MRPQPVYQSELFRDLPSEPITLPPAMRAQAIALLSDLLLQVLTEIKATQSGHPEGDDEQDH